MNFIRLAKNKIKLKIFQTSSAMEYFSEASNMIDVSAIILYLIGFGTRFIATEGFFMISK